MKQQETSLNTVEINRPSAEEIDNTHSYVTKRMREVAGGNEKSEADALAVVWSEVTHSLFASAEFRYR